ncbi:MULTISPECIES: PIN domain-containing protein [unclassified Sphingomonas]|uniref:PIN domain-containing protein n=1 Tax=unclassified Sphingomonas TaxID=196159 RepID=UPI0008305661|nr:MULTISPECIES: PIN domain-containing protein [unclassified Sphingomonas]
MSEEAKVDRKRQTETRELETRHAFLDTQVFWKLRHNPANRALRLVAQHVAGHRLVMHTTDITLQEVARQIAEDVEQTRAVLTKATKDVERWRHSVPDIAPMPNLGFETSRQLFAAFHRASRDEWRTTEHTATAHPAIGVFADYFAKRSPFDKAGSKEFPDAFVLHTLEAWCAAHGQRMYVVTMDAAMHRFAEASSHLIPLDTIEELLGAAIASAADEDGEAEAIADALLNAPEFDYRFEQAIGDHMDELILVYGGDLPEGEATGADLGGVIRFVDYRIVSRTATRIGLLVNTDVEINVNVAFENRRYASHDQEDDTWIGSEWDSTVVGADIALELYLEMEIATGEIVGSELIRNEYHVH